MAKTSASYSIIDYNDGLTIISKINSNHPDTLAYDPASGVYNPSWSTTPLALTPTAYVAGKAGDIIAQSTAKVWSYRRAGATSWTNIVNGTNGFTINSSSVLGFVGNSLFDGTHSTVEFKFSYTYHDSVLNLDFAYEVTKTFARISNGTSVVIARAWSENGEQFKNKSIPTSITLRTELIRGVTTDTTSLTYQWQKYSSGTWSNIASSTSTTYIVNASSVLGAAQFRCNIKDTDSSSDTYNQTFTTNGITILDLTDPYQAVISSSEGAFLKNGSGSTILTCKVYQNGTEVTSGLTYKWYKNGSATVVGTSNTFTVTHDMVSVKADFTCEVS
jgi:hypothetical protein